MGLFDSLATILTAPVKVLDQNILAPIAEQVDEIVKDLDPKDRRNN